MSDSRAFAIPKGYKLADHIDDSIMPIFGEHHRAMEIKEKDDKNVDENTKEAAKSHCDLIDNLNKDEDKGEEVIEFIKQYLKKNNETQDQCMVYGTTLLSLACLWPNTTAVQWLIDNGAKVNETNQYGWAPLHFLTADRGSDSTTEIAKMLVKAKADVNLPTEKTGRTPLMLTASRNTFTWPLLEFLLRSKANVRDGSRELIADKQGTDILALAGKELCLGNARYNDSCFQKDEIAERKGTSSETFKPAERKSAQVKDASLGTGPEEAVKQLIEWADTLEKGLPYTLK